MMRNPFRKWGTSPEADWHIMFGIFGLLLLVAVAWSLYLFAVVRDNTPAENVGSQILTQAALHQTALFYDEKAVSFQNVKSTPDITPDPSK